MNLRHQFILTLISLTVFITLNLSAQENTKTNLPESAKLRIGKGTLGEIAYFPDGTRFAVATSIGIRVYDSITGKELYQLYDPKYRVIGINKVSISPNGETIVTKSPEETVLLWNASSGKRLRQLNTDENRHYNTLFSPNGKYLLHQVEYHFKDRTRQ